MLCDSGSARTFLSVWGGGEEAGELGGGGVEEGAL